MSYRGEPYNRNYYAGNHPEGYSDITQTQKYASNRADDIQSFYGTFKEKDKILVVGCAYGYLVDELTKRDTGKHTVIGLDISSYAIDQAHTLFPTLDFQNIDFFNNTFKDDEFNLVILEDVIDCMTDKGSADSMFEEATRIITPTGMIYAFMNSKSLYYLTISDVELQKYVNTGVMSGKTMEITDVGHLPIRADKRVVVS